MLNAIQSGIVLDSTKKRLAELEERKKELTIEITQEQIKRPALTKEQISFGIHKFRKIRYFYERRQRKADRLLCK